MNEAMVILSVGTAYVFGGLVLLGVSLGSFGAKMNLEPVRVRSRRK